MNSILLPALLATAFARPSVVVLTSDDLPRYQTTAQAFAQSMGMPVDIIPIKGDRNRAMRVAGNLTADPPPLIFAIGEKAAWTAVHHGPMVPIVHAMVDDPERYEITGTFVTGVQATAPPDDVLAQLRLFAPDVERLGIIIGASNTSPAVRSSIAAAKEAGFEVIARRVGSPKDVKRAFLAIRSEIDALWLLPDGLVIDPYSFHYLRREMSRARMPMLAWSPRLVEAGALMCVTPDAQRVAAQAAALSARILGGENAGAIAPLAPDATRVVLNRDALDALDLRIDDGLLDFVDEVVRQPSAR